MDDNVKIIKTRSGFTNKINYNYDFSSVVDIAFEQRPTITFDAATKTIIIPVVDTNRKVTGKCIRYKFTGQYFEKVSNLAK